jgi:hypothetical protein
MVNINITHEDLSPVEVYVTWAYDDPGRPRNQYTVFLFGVEVFVSDWAVRDYDWDPEVVEAEWKDKWQTFQVDCFKQWLDAQKPENP